MPKKNSLVENINRRKKSGTSRSKEDSTVSGRAYRDMQNGWPGSAKKKARGTGPQKEKDPKGGLTAAGRAAFKAKEGANLKPGVKGAADTPEKMRRKGSFLRRMFTHLRGPLVDAKGQPTRLALSARAWGEPVPKTVTAAEKLAAKGARLLEKYAKSKVKKERK
jgi:Domain of unknown function (DUF6321)